MVKEALQIREDISVDFYVSAHCRTRNREHGVIQINVFQGEEEEKGHWHCLTSSLSIKQHRNSEQ